MANFKVGDRVRKIRHAPDWCCWTRRASIGSQGEILGLGEPMKRSWWRKSEPAYYVLYDDYPGYVFNALEHQLAPLTPPAADAWAADKVKQVTKPQHMDPVVAERLREFDRNFTD